MSLVLAFQQSDFALSFLSLFLEGAPYILLGTLISGFIDVYMPSNVLERALPKNKFLAILSCGFMGLILPVCECAVVPVIRRLVAKGLPVSCAFTYMLAAPILNPITIWSTWHAFDKQDQMWNVLSRCALGYSVAIIVGILVMMLPLEKVLRDSVLKTIKTVKPKSKSKLDTECDSHSECCGGHDHTHSHHGENDEHADGDDCCSHHHDHCDGHSHAHTQEPDHRIVSALRSGMRDAVDVGVYFTIGVCLAAMFNILYNTNQQSFSDVLSNPVAETGGMMLLAFLLSVCSTSDAFMAATYNFAGAGAKMSFMVLGPMLDVKLVFLYQTVMRKKFLLWFTVFIFILVGLLSWTWERYEIGKETATKWEEKVKGEDAVQTINLDKGDVR